MVRGMAVFVIAVLLCGCSKRGPVPTEFETLYGDRITVLKEGSDYWTDAGIVYQVSIFVPKDTSESDVLKLKDAAFVGYVGPKAERLGFTRVVIQDFDDRDEFRSSWPVSFDISVSVGLGPAKLFSNRTFYDRGADSGWTRNGFRPDPLQHVSEATLDSGVRFALTEAVEDFPNGVFIYDCLTCQGDTDIHEAVRDIYGFARKIAVPAAEQEGLRKARIYLFMGHRINSWQFPSLCDFTLEKKADGWQMPKATPEKWEALLTTKFRQLREEGERLRKTHPSGSGT